jgi:hypothetical protein
MTGECERSSEQTHEFAPSNNGMQRTWLRAAVDAER